MKLKTLLLLSFIGILFFCNFIINNSGINSETEFKSISILEKVKLISERTSVKASEIKTFLKNNTKYNQDIVFLVDMKIPSKKYRFFVYDLKKDSVTDFGLVAHGSGSRTETDSLQFSNKDGSLMTSLGKYNIGNSYNGTFGKAYKMNGLDKTNSNAYIRNIVLHAHKDMPYKEQINPIMLSWGCPMVNEKFYLRIQSILDTSEKDVLMYIYY